MDEAMALEVRFGRYDGRWWRVSVFPHPTVFGLYSYRLEWGAVVLGGGLQANPTLHGGYETVSEALAAGVNRVFQGRMDDLFK